MPVSERWNPRWTRWALSSGVGLCCALASPTTGAITNASAEGAEDYPGVGAIVLRRNSSCGHEVVCTGTLIAPGSILTAAHCGGVAQGGEPLEDPEWSFVLAPVLEGLDETAHAPCPELELDPGVLHPIGAMVAHPEFDFLTLLQADSRDDFLPLHDIAVWSLDEPVEGIEPAAVLGMAGALEGEPDLTMVGYGPDLSSGPRRRVAATALVDIGESELRLDGEAQRCKGDSGGPTFLRSAALAEPAIASVTSRIFELDIVESPCGSVIETRVDAHLDFLLAEVPELREAAAAEPGGDDEADDGDDSTPAADGSGGCRVTDEPSGPPWTLLLGATGLWLWVRCRRERRAG